MLKVVINPAKLVVSIVRGGINLAAVIIIVVAIIVAVSIIIAVIITIVVAIIRAMAIVSVRPTMIRMPNIV